MGSESKRKRTTKRQQRDSTLPPGHGDRVLDKLLLLEHVIPRGEVLQVLHDTGCLDARRCTLTFEVTCWLVLAMGVLTDLPLRQVFKAARRLHGGEETPHRSSLCRPRPRRAGPRPPAPGRRPAAPALRAPGTPPSPPRGPGRLLPGPAADGPRRRALHRARLRGQRPGLRLPPRRPRAGGPTPRCASSAWWSWAPTPSRPWCSGGSRAATRASRAWPRPCSATCGGACCCCGTAASSATRCGRRCCCAASCWPGSAPAWCCGPTSDWPTARSCPSSTPAPATAAGTAGGTRCGSSATRTTTPPGSAAARSTCC